MLFNFKKYKLKFYLFCLKIFIKYNKICQCKISLPGTGSCYSIRISKL